jgi:hypothetical protein
VQVANGDYPTTPCWILLIFLSRLGPQPVVSD